MDSRGMRLSIVVNMYNTAMYLPKCMDSLLAQDIDVTDYEIILVNDGSTDNSLELANEYVKKSECDSELPSIKVVSHANKGLAGARNSGVDMANGQYLCFVDPDDYIEKNSMSALLKQMDSEELDMLKFNYQKVDKNYNYLADTKDEASFDYSSKIMTGKQFMYERLGVACYVWTYIYRLDFIKKNNIRFIEGIYLDDTLWLPRVLQKCERINCINVRHQFYLQRSTSMVRITDKSVMPKKINGQIELIKTLQMQKNEANDSGVKMWYDKMIAHSVLTLLRLVARHEYESSDNVIRVLKQINVLPIQSYRTSMLNYIRYSFINISPKFFCKIVKYRQSC